MDYLLLVISENSIKSPWVNFEVSQFMGIAENKRILKEWLEKRKQAFDFKDIYADTLMYRINEDDLESVRVLHSAFEHQNKYYELTVISSLVEEDDLIEDSFWSVTWLFIILISSIIIINNIVLRKIWNPFYEILNRLKRIYSSRDLLHQ